MMRRVWLGAALLAAPLHAGEVVTSPAPGKVAVTIYRAPQRPADEPMALGWLGGYALITETREVSIPAGEAEIRFEGVAAGMLPESAIVTGLPGDVAEKNLDADLLSPRNLYARAFGRPVVLRRTDAQGRSRAERAIIRSSPDGAAVLQTKAGFEVANCGGLSDALAYKGLPAGLNARPTLSVTTQSPRAVRARVQLSYLAWGFDWQAHYVLAMRPGAREANLTAWVTLASSDATSFSQAKAAVVGGKPHFDEVREGWPESGEMELTCQITHMPPPPAVMPAPPPLANVAMPAPVAMAMRADVEMKALAPVVVSQEALGDLKLYRVPMPTTVAAHAQKQVALLDTRRVKLALIHGADIAPGSGWVEIKLRLQNRKADGLGLALPAGKLTVVQPLGEAAIPVGEGRLDDKSEGEEATIAIGSSPQVRINTIATPWQNGTRMIIATVTNANRWPVHFEGRLRIVQGASVERSSAPLTRRDGLPLWRATIPAHSHATLTYTEREPIPPRR